MIYINFWLLCSIGILKMIGAIIPPDMSYKNYQLWRINVGGNVSDEFAYKISKEDVWNKAGNNLDVLLNPNTTSAWDELLRSQNMSYIIITKNIEEEIDMDVFKNMTSWRRAGGISWTSYPKSLKEIYTFLAGIAANNSYCTLSVVGKTAHKTEIKMLKLSNGKATNNAILVEAGMHAREWTAIVSVLYVIESIARNFSDQPSYITDNDWYIIPVLNPDGYEYSLRKDRLWKKNRRLFSGPCDGVDINRNFDYSWGQRGASYDICSPRFCGVYAFSEAESQVIKELMSSRYFFSYVSVHSYGKKILFPWAVRPNPTKDIKNHIEVSKKMADAMHAIDNHVYKTGSVGRSGDESGSGTAIDWMYSQGATYSFVMETRGEGVGGFVLDPIHLNMAIKEIRAGILRLASLL